MIVSEKYTSWKIKPGFIINKLRKLLSQPVHVVLLSLFPTLFLYSINIRDTFPEAVISPLITVSVFTLIIYALFFLFFRHTSKTALLSSLFLVLFFSYNRLFDLVKLWQVTFLGVTLGPNKMITLVFIAIFLLGVWYLLRFKGDFTRINKSLNIFALTLLAISIFNIAYYETTSQRMAIYSSNLKFTQDLPTLSEKTLNPPDIYYFIFDRYAGEETLKDLDFDNSDLMNFLKERGFYIATGSKSNYPNTTNSLSSSLNMDYLNFLPEKIRTQPYSDRMILLPLIRNNKVAGFLKSQDYKYYHVSSWWEPTRDNNFADVNLLPQTGYLAFNEFLREFLQAYVPVSSTYLNELMIESTSRWHQRVFSIFDYLPKEPGPKFVFAHILLPHAPYVFSESCESLTEKDTRVRTTKENYLNQISCANLKIKSMVGKILSKSSQEPIIVISADEGPHPIKTPLKHEGYWKDASLDSIKEKFPISTAIYLPNIKENPLYSTISPVNFFRVIFNTYFHTNLELLPDKNYVFPDPSRTYNFIEVTEKLK
ncbi:MAG: hypothetical protein A3A61_04305 [Candidatus Woykebacteria bacterium RIFCSPLOWO2_01_FULL_43_14]|uniref:Sulfatase N-terminal domain-containing protein n=2 Tax=Candidatus Woykeibacteriota TaxID=1817899 RepID=A0A1G1WXI2_9BACT|nr:MAG: hypothetical protein A3J50_02605 [Candidatus Woykebacteria bacterium RIFCSPHIGHO2_02_FULL_43_16b]OGY32281.1 MAG: hypothetical protein A3A61_04305 [Candidatus Woykebacteria bacterium RIFCSPLOWO2_01_FULL_43_14]